ncbi:MAG: rhomboid family intramembrane serine protease [Desulfobacterales bacterium]|jgi:rhomboid protease GluP
MPAGRRQSLLCPKCRKLISADETRCPHCGVDSPASAVRHALWTRPFGDPALLIRTVILLNVGMFVLSLLIDFGDLRVSLNPLAFLTPAHNSLLLLGESGRYAIDQIIISITGIDAIDRLLRWTTLLTANYLHGSLMHIVFNMIALMQIGPLTIREYGSHRMIVIYTLGGIFGFFLSYIAGIGYTLGASGAICALIGAMIYYGKSRGGVYGNAIYRQIGGWAIGLFLFGLLPGINNWAHGGGMAAGALLGFLMGYRDRSKDTPMHQLLAKGCVTLTVVFLCQSVLFAFYYLVSG